VVLPWSLFSTFPLWLIDTDREGGREGVSDGRVKGGRKGGREGERRVQRMCPPL